MLWDLLFGAGRHRDALLQITAVRFAVQERFGEGSPEDHMVAVRLGMSLAGAPSWGWGWERSCAAQQAGWLAALQAPWPWHDDMLPLLRCAAAAAGTPACCFRC